MLWEDKEIILLDSGRKVHVPGGIIGLNAAGDTLYAGERPMRIGDSPDDGSGELLPAEKLDVIRAHMRQAAAYEQAAVKALLSRGSGGIDID